MSQLETSGEGSQLSERPKSTHHNRSVDVVPERNEGSETPHATKKDGKGNEMDEEFHDGNILSKVGGSGNSSILQPKTFIVENDEAIGLHVETRFSCSSFSIHEHVVLSGFLDFPVSEELLFGRHAFSFRFG